MMLDLKPALASVLTAFCIIFFKINSFLVLVFHLNLNRRLKAFSEIANHNKFIRGPDKIKLCQDRLKVLKVECPFLSFF